MTNDRINLRNLVLNMLIEVNEQKKSHIVLKDTLDKYDYLEKSQRAFITMLFRGTIERQIELDYIIGQFSKTPINKMKPVIRYIMRMSVYQLKYMDAVPASAVCNEAVKLTEKRKLMGLKAFVNGVLRNIAKNISDIEYPKDKKENMSVVYSVPKWIIEMWSTQYGIKRTESILSCLYKNTGLAVRCNISKAHIEEIIESLEYAGVLVKRTELYQNALIISKYNRLSRLDVFNAGLITVQDLSSMLVGLATDVAQDSYIIDVCAAPGGKSLHFSELMKGTGIVEARDLTEYKIGLIKENINRIGSKNIITKVMDATVFDKDSVGKADIVVADLPCSGLGVINKKSDIKYNVSMEQIMELQKLQRQILQVVSQYVKPGGILIYSTCTVNQFENDDNVKWIEENLSFRLQPFGDSFPDCLNKEKGFIQIYPGDYGMDGFFISGFIKC